MPSDLRSPFLELDQHLCQTFLRLSVEEASRVPPGCRRPISARPLALPAPGASGPDCLEEAAAGGRDVHWSRASELPRSSLQRLPFQSHRSVSLTEGCRSLSSRYKTELCRPFEESGACKYGAKCQFAHGAGELRGLSRHPKYKTEPCRTFHTSGICPYGARCHFIHNAEEGRPRAPQAPLFLHSLSTGSSVAEPLPSASPPLPETFLPCDSLRQPTLLCSLCKSSPLAFPGLLMLQKSVSADSLSDQEDSGSSGGSSGSESPGLACLGQRLPIFSRLSISDD